MLCHGPWQVTELQFHPVPSLAAAIPIPFSTNSIPFCLVCSQVTPLLQARYRLHDSGSLDLSQSFVPSLPWTTRSDLSLSETSSLLRSDTHCTELRSSLGLANRHTPAGHYLTHSPVRPRSATTAPSPTAGSTPMPLRSYLCTRPTDPFNHHSRVPTAPASSGFHPGVSPCLV